MFIKATCFIVGCFWRSNFFFYRAQIRGCTYTTVLQSHFVEIQRKIPLRKLVWQSPFILYSPGDELYSSVIFCTVNGVTSTPQETGMARKPFPSSIQTLLYHIAPVVLKQKAKKKASSITTLINTKGYPILYTVLCDIYSPYKLLSLSLDFVLILSWCIKY